MSKRECRSYFLLSLGQVNRKGPAPPQYRQSPRSALLRHSSADSRDEPSCMGSGSLIRSSGSLWLHRRSATGLGRFPVRQDALGGRRFSLRYWLSVIARAMTSFRSSSASRQASGGSSAVSFHPLSAANMRNWTTYSAADSEMLTAQQPLVLDDQTPF